jgi:predicted alpha/beta-hydrolase family hydrolase
MFMESINTSFGLVQKYGTGAVNVVFAHGSGIGMNHEFMQGVAAQMSLKNFTVYLFEFGYMQHIQMTGIKRPPPAVAKLELEFMGLLHELALPNPLIIGGKSLGGRVASLIVERTNAWGWFALGYPFHPQRKPQTLRVAHLLTNHKPGFIVQGSRDALGCYDEVLSYQLPTHIGLSWLADMDHSFKPFKASHYSQIEAIERSVLDVEQWAQCALEYRDAEV